MTLVICIDDNFGISFNGRRQSMDSALRKRIADISAGKTLYMSAYSASQFKEGLPENTVICEDIPRGRGFYFSEISSPVKSAEFDCVIVYSWNRRYPSDVRLAPSFFEGYKRFETFTFSGSSHDAITEEMWYADEKIR